MKALARLHAAGFALIQTGGGCTAFQRINDDDGTHILMTAAADPSAPSNDAMPVDVGLYANGADHSEAMAYIYAPNVTAALRMIAAGKWTNGDFDIARHKDTRHGMDIQDMEAAGFSWEYPGFYKREIAGGVVVTVGYDNGPARFCVQLADNDGGSPEWPAEVDDVRGDCNTVAEVLALASDLDRAFMSPAARDDLDSKENPR